MPTSMTRIVIALTSAAGLFSGACSAPTGPNGPSPTVGSMSDQTSGDAWEYRLPPPNRWPVSFTCGRLVVEGIHVLGVDPGRSDSRDVCLVGREGFPENEERIGHGLGGRIRGIVRPAGSLPVPHGVGGGSGARSGPGDLRTGPSARTGSTSGLAVLGSSQPGT